MGKGTSSLVPNSIVGFTVLAAEVGLWDRKQTSGAKARRESVDFGTSGTHALPNSPSRELLPDTY